MPRKVRLKSENGIYHVMFRALNKQKMFIDDEDCKVFLGKLNQTKDKSGFKVYAYCLMSNHIHLLIKEEKETLGIAFRRFGASYVHWYNQKYKRLGPLFQDRYKSEVIDNDTYFLTVLRYIHQNPLKAKVVKKIQDYPWSSYHEYFKKPIICDTKYVLGFFSSTPKIALSEWKKYHHALTNDKCLDLDEVTKLDDNEALKVILSIAKVKKPQGVQQLEKNKQHKAIKLMKEHGLSIRQIARLTGLSFSVVRYP